MRLGNLLAVALLLLATGVLLGSSLQAAAAPSSGPERGSPWAPALGDSPQADELRALGIGITPAEALGFQVGDLGQLRGAQPLATSVPITLGITLIPRNGTNLAVASGGERPFLTNAGFRSAYAPTPEGYTSVEGSLVSSGFTLTHTYTDRMFILANGNAGEAQRLFSTRLVTGDLDGRAVILPAAPPVLPPAMAPYVLAVSGLSTNLATFHVDSQPLANPAGSSIYPNYPHFMYGLDGLYNLTGGPHWGWIHNNPNVPARIGLLLWGEGFSPSDLTSFLQTMYPSNEPTFTVEPHPLDGAPAPSPGAVFDPSGTAFELTLDMEWSESQAPGATLVPVYVPDGPAPSYSPSDTNMEDGLNYLVNTAGVNVISMSFGMTDGSDLAFQASYDATLQVAATRGISVFASSGDNGGTVGGSLSSCTGTPGTEFPASSPWVTAVGGTAPDVAAALGGSTSSSWVDEPAWAGSTGGFSSSYSAPSWQLVGSAGNVIRSQGNGHRGIPDVSGPSSNNFLYYNSTVQKGEGTSFASPMWAGIAAEMVSLRGSGFGLLTPALYRLGQLEDKGVYPLPYHDVIQGSNCLYSAAAGWDPVTGWGSPADGVTLYGDLINGLVTVGVSTNPAVVTPGGTVHVTVTTSNASGALGGIPITITVYSQPQTTTDAKLESTFSVTTDGAGSAQGSFIVPVTYAYSEVLVKAGTFSATTIGSASLLVKVSVLATYWGPLSPLLTWEYGIPFFALLLALATLIGWFLGRRLVAPPAPAVRPKPGTAQGQRPVRPAVRRPVPGAAPKPGGSPPRALPRPAAPAQSGRSSPAPRVQSPPAATAEPSPSPPEEPAAETPTTPAPEPTPDTGPAEPWTGITSYSVASQGGTGTPETPEAASAPAEEAPTEAPANEPATEVPPEEVPGESPPEASPTEIPTESPSTGPAPEATSPEAIPEPTPVEEPAAPEPSAPEPPPAPPVAETGLAPEPPAPAPAPRKKLAVRKRSPPPPPPPPPPAAKPKPTKRKASKP